MKGKQNTTKNEKREENHENESRRKRRREQERSRQSTTSTAISFLCKVQAPTDRLSSNFPKEEEDGGGASSLSQNAPETSLYFVLGR